MVAAVDRDRDQAAPVGKVAEQVDALLAEPAPVERAARRPKARKVAAVALAVSSGVDAIHRVHTIHIMVIRI